MNIVALSILIFACLISILFGLRYSYIYISAIIHHKNLIKNKKHLIFAFTYLFIIPFFILFIYIIMSSTNLGGSIPLLQIKTTSPSFTSQMGYMSLKSQEIEFSQNEQIELTIKNKYHTPKEFYIDIKCTVTTCDYTFTPQENKILLNPEKTFILPITVNLDPSTQNQKTEINITLKDKDGKIYDSIPFKLS
jgi:hypothetical protein